MSTKLYPPVSFHPKSANMRLIKNELQSFGLNPSDWRTAEPKVSEGARLILVHRDDDDLRLAIEVRDQTQIQNVEWLLS